MIIAKAKSDLDKLIHGLQEMLRTGYDTRDNCPLTEARRAEIQKSVDILIRRFKPN